MKPFIRLIAVAALVALTLGTATAAANHEDPGVEHEFADPAFESRWERLDRPVTEFGVDRTFWWGPGPYTDGMMEPYADSPGGERLVQYFDKSRMEINNPGGDPAELWYVTNGLLVVEMITGDMQVGDNEFVDREPANVPVAGDPDNQFGPTYATLAPRLADAPLDQSALITQRIERDGTVTSDPALEEYGIGIGTFVPETNHTVAAPFWEIMTTNGTIYANGELTNGPIFGNPFYAVGFPITEPYWSTATVAGVDQDVLLQCFERRCLTYTPGNELGWQVEAGNVGQHYYRWRHGNGEPQPEPGTVNVYFVALEDNGQNGQLIGCQDSLIPVEMEIEATDDAATRVERALLALFGVEGSEVGDDGLYNSLYQSNLTVDAVTVDDSGVTVALSGDVLVGGVCDEPRFIEQIRATVLDAAGASAATITVNGTPLDELFGPPGNGETETIQLHFVALEDAGESGQLIGCNDSLVPVDYEIEATDDVATRVERALAALFGVDDEFYGESGLYNSLYQSNLTVDSVTVDGTAATVAITGDVLIGGECDEPRVIEQIRATVLAATGVDTATITINGTPLDEFFGPGEIDAANIYFIAIGDDGQNGIPVGIGDSLVPVEMEIEPTADTNVMIQSALELLLGFDSETITSDGGLELTNSLFGSNLSIVSVDVTGGLATVHLSGDLIVGGVGDEPRVIEQIRQTVLQFQGVQVANIFVNGEYLPGYFGEWDLTGGILATFDVEGELFQLWTTNDATIEAILALQAGEAEATIPNGPILREPGEALHNQPWSWHLDPEQTVMAEATVEVCDGLPSYVEANLDEFVDNIGQYCPWGAELVHVEDLRVPDDGGETS